MTKEKMNEIAHSIDKLEVLMDVLREECPWDRKQTLSSLRTYTLEEVHEVLEAIDRDDWDSLKSELGDLLLQIVFYARIAKEQERFTLHDIAETVVEKMVRRHPHVFDQVETEDLSRQWEELKDTEHADRKSLMDGVPPLPALAYANKVQKRAARVGFDWIDAGDVMAKMREELGELEDEVRQDAPLERLEDEFGDVLFTIVNLGRKLGLDSELCLMRTNRKFGERFRAMEQLAATRNLSMDGMDIEALEMLYQQAKSGLQEGSND